jgi:hypothetical protein
VISDSSSINANHLGMQINEEQNDGWYNFQLLKVLPNLFGNGEMENKL